MYTQAKRWTRPIFPTLRARRAATPHINRRHLTVAAALPAASPNLTHIALHTSKIEDSIQFYERYCGLKLCRTNGDGPSRSVWLAAPGKEKEFVLVLIAGGTPLPQQPGDYSHLGFDLPSNMDVDAIAKTAKEVGILAMEPREMAYPVGYFCMLQDPDGRWVEFSHGQPLGE